MSAEKRDTLIVAWHVSPNQSLDMTMVGYRVFMVNTSGRLVRIEIHDAVQSTGQAPQYAVTPRKEEPVDYGLFDIWAREGST